MNEKVTEDDTIVSHNVLGSAKQYVHQDTQNTKENDIQNTNDDMCWFYTVLPYRFGKDPFCFNAQPPPIAPS